MDFEPYIVRKTMGETTFTFLVGDAMGQSWYDTPKSPSLTAQEIRDLPFVPSRGGEISWLEMQVLRDHIALPGSTVVECGCHHGLTTVLLSAWVGPTGFVHAFDAVLNNAAIVQKNLALNGIGNAAVYCSAIGGEYGIMHMQNESNVIVAKTEVPGPRSTIMVRVSPFFDRPPDALKLDIEGAELAVLEAEQDWIARIPRLAIEVHTDLLPADGIARLLRILAGRNLFALWNDKEIRPYRGEAITERVHLFAW